MHYGFVLDQQACIGCHACTVACKAENDVPLGSFRTWVKWIEHGEFPDTRRSAAVLRCNHCADAPCVSICPTRALEKRADGVVDLDPRRCIGCASCIQACPYDAIHIDDRVGTAAKCHFCAHRLEVGLAPACVSVCPEQAIKVIDAGDVDMRRELGARAAVVRKGERGTRPRTFYLGADPATLDPLAVDGSRTLAHAEVPDPLPAPGNTEARAVYDVPQPRHWGWPIAFYMVTKAIAAGALVLAAASVWSRDLDPRLFGGVSLAFVALTAALLVMDLHKPARFWYLLTKPNPGSWLVLGGWVLMAHGALSCVWLVPLSVWERVGVSVDLAGTVLAPASLAVAAMTAVYTAFLFRQARGRELWCEDVTLPLVLLVQMAAAAVAVGWLVKDVSPLWLLGYLAVMLLAAIWPPRTRQAKVAHRWMVRQPAFLVGFVVAAVALLLPPLLFVAFLLFDWVYVRAGQEVALS